MGFTAITYINYDKYICAIAIISLITGLIIGYDFAKNILNIH